MLLFGSAKVGALVSVPTDALTCPPYPLLPSGKRGDIGIRGWRRQVQQEHHQYPPDAYDTLILQQQTTAPTAEQAGQESDACRHQKHIL